MVSEPSSPADRGRDASGNGPSAERNAGAAPRRSLVAPTVIATVFTAMAMMMSIANQAIAAAWFGAGADYDFYRAASALPNVAMMVLLATLPAVFVPAFVEREVADSPEAAWALASRLLVAVVALTAALALALYALAPWLIGAGVLTQGTQFAPPGRGFTLTTLMLRIQLPNLVLAGAAGVLSGLCLARQAFSRPAAAPLIQTGVMLACIVLLVRPLGILALAVGSTLGPLAQVLFLLPVLRGGFRPRFDIWHPELRRMALMLAPLLAAALVSKGADLVETRVASGLAVGSLATIGFASVISDRVGNLVAQGVGLTSFPELSRHAAERDRRAFRERFSLALRFTLLIAIPTAVGLGVLRDRLVAVLLQHGRFSAADTRQVGLTLLAFLGVFVAGAVGRVVANGLYAQRRAGTLALVGLLGMLLYVALARSLPARVEPPVVGLAAAWSVTNLVNLILAFLVLRRHCGPLDGGRILRSALRMALAAAAMGAAVHVTDSRVAPWVLALEDPWRSMALAVELALLAALGFGLYAGLLRRLGGSEVAGLSAALTRLARRPA